MRLADTREIEELLGDLAFPASKQEIVEHAHNRGTGDGGGARVVVPALGTYGNVAEVVRSVPLEPDPGRSPAEQDYQRRHHSRPGLAEHMRDSRRPPVQDELRREDE